MADSSGLGLRRGSGRSLLGLDREEQWQQGNRQNVELLEREGDSKLEILANTISSIKGYANSIHGGIKEGDAQLDALEQQMDKTQMDLGVNMENLKKLLVESKSRHMCYLVMFFVGVLVVLYYLTK